MNKEFNKIAFTDVFRPDGFEKVIMLPRVKDVIEKGLKNGLHFILYSRTPGMGKTTISKIIGDDNDELKINCSNQNGIDVLRDIIEPHCLMYSINHDSSCKKVVRFEEFAKASKALQEGLNDFIEDPDKKLRNVIFVATLNDINAIIPALKSRFVLIDLEPQNQEEVEYLEDKYLKYIRYIIKHTKTDESFNYDNLKDEDIESNIDKNFPCFRNCVKDLQVYALTQNLKEYSTYLEVDKFELFDFIVNGKNDLYKNYELCFNDYKNRSLNLIKTLGRPFMVYIKENEKYKNQFLSIGQKYLKIYDDVNKNYESAIDKEMMAFNYICELKNLFVK